MIVHDDSLPAYDDAVTAIELLSDDAQPNDAVRETARIARLLAQAAAGPGTQHLLRPAGRPPGFNFPWGSATASMVLWRLCGPLGLRGTRHWGHLRTVQSYEALYLPVTGMLRPGQCDRVTRLLDSAVPTYLSGTPSQWPPSPERSELLCEAVRLISSSLTGTATVMGSRTPETVRTLEARLRRIPGTLSRLSAAMRSMLACPGPDRVGEAEALLCELESSAPEPTAAFPTRVPDHRGAAADGIVYGPEFSATESMIGIAARVHLCAKQAHQLIEDPGTAPTSPVLSGQWSHSADSHISKALWHLARARKPPALWT